MLPGWLLACVVSLPLVAALQAATEPLPIEAFLNPATFELPKLSPGGGLLAARRTQQFRDLLAVVDTSTGAVSFAGDFGDARLVNYWWKGDDTMLLLVEEGDRNLSFRRLDLRTKSVAALRQLRSRWVTLIDEQLGDPDHVLVGSVMKTGYDLCRLDLRHDQIAIIEPAVPHAWKWLVDATCRPVAAFGQVDKDWFVVTRASPRAKWRRTELGHNTQPDLLPLAVHRGKILALDYATGDTASAVLWDPATNARAVVCSFPQSDCEDVASWTDCSTRPRAITYAAERRHLFYLEDADRRLAAEIDAALPETSNEVVSTSADERRLVIAAARPDRPESFWLLDRSTQALAPLGSSSASVPQSKLAIGSSFECPAADGLRLSGLLYTPPDHPDGPLIVVLDGDLGERTPYEYSPVVQLLASRGYAVMTLNCRGVAGFGRNFEKAGTGHVHDTMADDVAVATRWVVQHRPAADRRVVLLGQDTSGVLAVHVLARHPDLYAAWVNVNTPMDMRALEAEDVVFGVHDARSSARELGGEWKAEAYLEALDPTRLLEQIKAPSFHFYSRRFRDNSVALGGARVEKYVSRRGAPCRFVLGDALNKVRVTKTELREMSLRQQVRLNAELFAFLEKSLPAR